MSVLITVREFITLGKDIDVFSDYSEDLGVCMCGPIELIDEGAREFADVLDYDIEVYDCGEALVLISDCEDCEHRSERAQTFFNAAAGYCSVDDYKKWFKEV